VGAIDPLAAGAPLELRGFGRLFEGLACGEQRLDVYAVVDLHEFRKFRYVRHMSSPLMFSSGSVQLDGLPSAQTYPSGAQLFGRPSYC